MSSRPTPWFRDAVAPMLEGLLGGAAWHGYANVRNDGLAPAFGDDLVVEVPVHLDASGLTPHPVAASMPPAALAFSLQVERSEQLLHAAWRDGDLDLVEQSFVEGPHLLDPPVARHLARAIATATGFADPGTEKAALAAGSPRPSGGAPRALRDEADVDDRVPRRTGSLARRPAGGGAARPTRSSR